MSPPHADHYLKKKHIVWENNLISMIDVRINLKIHSNFRTKEKRIPS
jgi:hypothetical protein